MKKKNIYICNTYYHLLISIIKTLLSGANADIVISTDGMNDALFNDKKLLSRLKESCVFNEVLFFDFSKEEIELQKNKFTAIRSFCFSKKISKLDVIDFKQYENIFIFFDNCLIGRILNNNKIYYNLLEDGTDTFKSRNKKRLYKPWSLKKVVKYIFNYREMGKSRYIKSIEVNDNTDLCIKHNNIIENNKQKLFEQLTIDQKNKIISIFVEKDAFKNLKKEYSLLITQPLFTDKLVSSEEEQIKVYSKIINQYINDDNILIKPHPREKIDYEKYFTNVTVLEQSFPLEIINFFENIKFNKVITISSTSLNIISNCNEKIILGWDWFYNELS